MSHETTHFFKLWIRNIIDLIKFMVTILQVIVANTIGNFGVTHCTIIYYVIMYSAPTYIFGIIMHPSKSIRPSKKTNSSLTQKRMHYLKFINGTVAEFCNFWLVILQQIGCRGKKVNHYEFYLSEFAPINIAIAGTIYTLEIGKSYYIKIVSTVNQLKHKNNIFWSLS